VKVRRLGAARRNRVHVDVKYGATAESERLKRRFLARLAQRNANDVGVSIGVSAGLQPTPELSVVQQHHGGAVAADDPRRSGHVTFDQRALEAVTMCADEVHGRAKGIVLASVDGTVRIEKIEQRAAVHSAWVRAKSWRRNAATHAHDTIDDAASAPHA
jgi:hypothetical protein